MTDKLLIDRTLLEQALKCLETPIHEQPLGMRTQTASALRAALAQEQEQKQKLLEAVRVRIMRTAYDCADDGEVEAYNSVKVLCTELLEMLK